MVIFAQYCSCSRSNRETPSYGSVCLAHSFWRLWLQLEIKKKIKNKFHNSG